LYRPNGHAEAARLVMGAERPARQPDEEWAAGMGHYGSETLMAADTPQRDDLRDMIAKARRDRERRDHSYRSRALQLLPPVCARCGRDFSGRRLRELTVHHRDHNHDNNPPDGSNWELLCRDCHENEHARRDVADAYTEPSDADAPAPSSYQPFADLDKLLKKPR
jgi:hypothetical protein